MKRPAVIAHRGASAAAPENTLPAFQLAMRQGADGIELDVHLTADGIPVVIHDETIDRTGTGTGRVADMRLDQLRKYDFGVWKDPSFAGTRIPTLSDVLMLLDGWQGSLNIELKTDVVRYPGIEAAVLKLVADADRQSRTHISSFHHESLAVCRRLNTGIELAALLDHHQIPDLPALKRMGVTAIHPDVRDATGAHVRRWHREGFLVRSYTVDPKPLVLWQALCGSDAVITNRPLESALFLGHFFRKGQGRLRTDGK